MSAYRCESCGHEGPLSEACRCEAMVEGDEERALPVRWSSVRGLLARLRATRAQLAQPQPKKPPSPSINRDGMLMGYHGNGQQQDGVKDAIISALGRGTSVLLRGPFRVGKSEVLHGIGSYYGTRVRYAGTGEHWTDYHQDGLVLIDEAGALPMEFWEQMPKDMQLCAVLPDSAPMPRGWTGAVYRLDAFCCESHPVSAPPVLKLHTARYAVWMRGKLAALQAERDAARARVVELEEKLGLRRPGVAEHVAVPDAGTVELANRRKVRTS